MTKLDITSLHELNSSEWASASKPLLEAGSPLAEWLNAILSATFAKIQSLHAKPSETVGLALHDPLCIYYVLNRSSLDWQFTSGGAEDIRIETTGQWTRGMCVVDRRNRKRMIDNREAGDVPGDAGVWLSERAGNRVRRAVGGLGTHELSSSLLNRIFNGHGMRLTSRSVI